MAFFNCESHLHVTLQIIHSTFTAKIDLKHTDDHIPYHATQLPPEALEMIATNKEKLLKDVWQDVQDKFPNASFSWDASHLPTFFISKSPLCSGASRVAGACGRQNSRLVTPGANSVLLGGGSGAAGSGEKYAMYQEQWEEIFGL
ncbi:uncharacterized protein EI90DRAFT_3134467 [Cantharellus anzutake]|uniref:uncharacterized protein n=1 Tax=Cantharellus anzutake TaxID=1750568 RepID=UPI001903070E|nr:uncharacterized protein EI90DRAFT_3134467 [Cantharellus anzutake]KAF8316453.1 hypothetical protein EI90DRAFT_3134467 [Cantharellus anzutake]